MYKPVKFLPADFGGFSLSLILSGLFIGLCVKSWDYIIPSAVMYFVAMYFFAKDNSK